MPDSPIIIEFRRMLAALDAAFPDSIHDAAADQEYFRRRDGVLAYIDQHPEVRQEARDAGLPTD
jgi:hypothetical protein